MMISGLIDVCGRIVTPFPHLQPTHLTVLAAHRHQKGHEPAQGRPQADARASSKFEPQFFLLNFEFSRFFSFTPTSELISFHFL